MTTLLLATLLAASAFEIEDERGELDIEGRIQPGYTMRFLHEGEEDRDSSRFFLNQARVKLDGSLVQGFSFELALDLAEHAAVEPKDLWVGYAPTEWLEFKAGQMKTPFSWDRLQPVGQLSFIKRPGTTSELVPGRDVGVQADVHTITGKAGLAAGAFTGQGANAWKDDDAGSPLLAARAHWMPLYTVHSGHSDLRRTGKPALGLGVSGAWSRDRVTGEEEERVVGLHHIDGDKLLLGADLVLRYRGLFVHAELVSARFTPTAGGAWTGAGLVVQAAYYIDPVRLEPALRLDDLNPSDQVTDDRQRTLTYALNFYPTRTHDLKLLLDYRQHLPAAEAEEGWKQDDLTLVMQLGF